MWRDKTRGSQVSKPFNDCRRASLKGPEAGRGLEKCWRQTRGGESVGSGSAGEVQGRDYWGSRKAGMCSKIAGPRLPRPPQATKDLPHGRDQGSCSTSAQAS
jgi:hypothetical protein